MSITIGNPGMIGRNLNKIFGKSENYPNPNINTGGTTRAYIGMGGERNFGLGNSQQPASVAGAIKKIIATCTLDGGGRMDYFTNINGVDVLAGLNSGLGTVTIEVDVPFVKDDLVCCSYMRNQTNSTFNHHDIIEIEWDDPLGEDIKHLYGHIKRNGSSVNGFLDLGVPALNIGGQFPLTDENEFKWKAPRKGTVLDMVYYGKVPVSADRPQAEFALRVNQLDASLGVMTQHNGFGIERFDGINIAFDKGDELNFRILGASTTVVCEGSGSARIQYD